MAPATVRSEDGVRIGVDASCWANGRGYGRFTRELMTAMVAQAPDDTFVFFADKLAHSQFDLQAANVEVVRVAVRESPTTAASAAGRRRLADLWRMTRAVAKHKPDVFFSPSVYSYFPLPVGQQAVVAIHDVIAERYPRLTLPSWRARLFWRLKVGLAIRQAALILTVSEFSKRDISERLQVPISQIRVAGEAPAAEYRPSDAVEIERAAARLELPRGASWFLYVGGFNPHKRVTAIVEAHAELVREDGDSAPYLLLVGDPAADAFLQDVERIREMIRELGTSDRTLWTGFVPDEELRHLHSGALALVLPSEVEGFGLPAVEAAACGTPVVATTESPLPEILRGGGIFVPPGDDEMLLGALRLLAKDETLRQEMGRRALERVGELSWDIGASAALSAIYEVAA
jgi:glycosyltransferase involved in cell wall biosynthesis